MSSSIPTQLAETIQATHINRHPDPAHDINPATAASAKKPVYTSIEKVSHGEDDDETVVVRAWPVQRTQKFPPIPDMRFEQSYLHSIEKAEGWGDVLYITVKDQVLLPLVQGVAWNFILCGWQHWNRNARIHGEGIGARVRRWWFGVNNWRIPDRKKEL